MTETWYNAWEYDLVDWVPCSGCFDVHGYTADLLTVLDSLGGTDFSLDLGHDFSDPYYGTGVVVECEYDEFNNITKRTFRGCRTCGGAGECVKEDVPDGKSWNQWVVVEGGITLGRGKLSKEI